MKFKKESSISLPLDEAMRHDLIFLNNPVLIQGLALTPVIAAANTLKNAAVLAVLALIIIVPVRVFGDMLIKVSSTRLRLIEYALISAIIYVPAIILVNMLFGSAALGAGMYLPLFVVDGIVLSRAEIQSKEGVARAAYNGLMTTLGYSAVLLFVGALRELLSLGTLWGEKLLERAPLPIESSIAGGMITVALLSAALQWAASAYKRERQETSEGAQND